MNKVPYVRVFSTMSISLALIAFVWLFSSFYMSRTINKMNLEMASNGKEIATLDREVSQLIVQDSALQKKAISAADVQAALDKDPAATMEIIRRAAQQERLAQSQGNQQDAENITKLAPALFSQDHEQFLGNPKGKVAFSEFLDYQCPHCRDAASGVDAFLQSHPGARVNIFQAPIFGVPSQLAAQAAVAASEQGKFAAMQAALMSEPDPMNAAEIIDAAHRAKLNMAKFNKDFQNSKTEATVSGQAAIAQLVGMTGTPAFVAPGRPLQEGYGNPATITGWLD